MLLNYEGPTLDLIEFAWDCAICAIPLGVIAAWWLLGKRVPR